MLGQRPLETLSRLGGTLAAIGETLGATHVVARGIEVVVLHGVLATIDQLLAERLRALASEGLHLTDDLGCVAGARVLLDQSAVAHQGLAFTRGQPIVVPQVDGGGGDAVDRAACQEEGIQRRQEHGSREDAEGPDGFVDQIGATVVAVVREQLVRGRCVVLLERVLGEALDHEVGVFVEQGMQLRAADVATRLGAGGEEAELIAQSGWVLPGGLALAVESPDVGDGAPDVAVDGARQRGVDARLECRVVARRFADQIVGRRRAAGRKTTSAG